MTPPRCDLCIRRMRNQGGNQTCPLLKIRSICTGTHSNGSPKMTKLTDAETWASHLKLWPNGCGQFKPGDLRRRSRPLDQETLF